MNFKFQKTKQQEKVKDYFDDDDDEDDNSFPGTTDFTEEDEVDPLDAFMSENTVQLKTEELRPTHTSDLPEIVSGHGQDDEETDEGRETERRRAHNAPLPVEYDSDGVPLGTKKGGMSEKVRSAIFNI